MLPKTLRQIVVPPGRREPRVGGAGVGPVAHLVEAVDVAPTVLDYCGIQSPPFFQGRSFAPLVQGQAYEARASAYIEYREPFGSSWKTVRTRDFWYTMHTAERNHNPLETALHEMLFDLRVDPHELRNVATDPAYAGALNEMRGELVRRWFTVENQYPMRTGRY